MNIKTNFTPYFSGLWHIANTFNFEFDQQFWIALILHLIPFSCVIVSFFIKKLNIFEQTFIVKPFTVLRLKLCLPDVGNITHKKSLQQRSSILGWIGRKSIEIILFLPLWKNGNLKQIDNKRGYPLTTLTMFISY